LKFIEQALLLIFLTPAPVISSGKERREFGSLLKLSRLGELRCQKDIWRISHSARHEIPSRAFCGCE
jgi:hypothetical protein